MCAGGEGEGRGQFELHRLATVHVAFHLTHYFKFYLLFLLLHTV